MYAHNRVIAMIQSTIPFIKSCSESNDHDMQLNWSDWAVVNLFGSSERHPNTRLPPDRKSAI